MEKNAKGALIFFTILIIYILSEYIPGLFLETRLPGLLIKILLVGSLTLYFKEWFPFKPKFDFLSISTGILIGALWVFLDPYYPPLMEREIYVYNTIEIILKFITGIIIAPIIEEFFTRYFLHRALQNKDWLKQKIGEYSLTPFIFTTLFFGFAHNEWLAGLIAGILLNLLWYKQKDMNSVVTAHAAANLTLGILVILIGTWQHW